MRTEDGSIDCVLGLYDKPYRVDVDVRSLLYNAHVRDRARTSISSVRCVFGCRRLTSVMRATNCNVEVAGNLAVTNTRQLVDCLTLCYYTGLIPHAIETSSLLRQRMQFTDLFVTLMQLSVTNVSVRAHCIHFRPFADNEITGKKSK